MRVKKQKQLRRHVSFYKTCFGFREPFKVLCDGTFVHHNLKQRLGGLQDSLSTLLGAPAKPIVTRCVIAELKKLGEAYSGSALAARRLDLIKTPPCWDLPLLLGRGCPASGQRSHRTLGRSDAPICRAAAGLFIPPPCDSAPLSVARPSPRLHDTLIPYGVS